MSQSTSLHQPHTSLEVEVAAILQGSKHNLPKERLLTEAEERALRAMNLEEACNHCINQSNFYILDTPLKCEHQDKHQCILVRWTSEVQLTSFIKIYQVTPWNQDRVIISQGFSTWCYDRKLNCKNVLIRGHLLSDTAIEVSLCTVCKLLIHLEFVT